MVCVFSFSNFIIIFKIASFFSDISINKEKLRQIDSRNASILVRTGASLNGRKKKLVQLL
jgi:hypothetical protein